MDVGDLLRFLPTRADLKFLKMEIQQETQAIGDKLVALHGTVEAGEATMKAT